MTAYYNDNDAFAVRWLKQLRKNGHISKGLIDARSIKEIEARDLEGYERCHFFAGIGGWDLALQWAGWPDDLEVWTGSCPCQPFSGAGQQLGEADERHLWPELFRLIQECRPSVVFGEQVASAAGYRWLDGVLGDLEAQGYACGKADIPAASVGAKHFRHRLWYVAHTDGARLERLHGTRRGEPVQPVEAPFPGDDWQADPEVLRAIDGFSNRLDRPPLYKERIRALGNAIVPQVGAEFIRSWMECWA